MASDGREQREKEPTMDDLAREEKERMGNGSNGGGFMKRNERQCRGDRYEPRDGLGIHRGRRSWPEKLAERSPEKFAVATSAIDVGQTDWRLAKPIVLLQRGRRGEHRHVFIGRVWVGGKIRVLGLF